MIIALVGNSLAHYTLMMGKGGLAKKRSKTIFLNITLADLLVTLFPMLGNKIGFGQELSRFILRSVDLGDIGERVGGWLVILQGVQVYPDLRLGLLQLHAGGPGHGQAQSCYSALEGFWISEQVRRIFRVCNLNPV